jgi:ribose transport system substrate-binding protein
VTRNHWLRALVGLVLMLVLAFAGTFTNVASARQSSSPAHAKLTIAVIPKAVGFFYWGTVKAGATDAARHYGVNLIWKGVAAETDVTGQVNLLTNLINQHINGLAFAATDTHALVQIATLAKSRHIPVINIDSGITPQNIPLVATSNVNAAKSAADYLARAIGGKGDVALLPFFPTAATSQQRQQGFTQEIHAKYPGITIHTQYDQSDAATALRVTNDLLTRFPNLKGIFAANEPGAIGALAALKARHLVGKVKLVGFDNAPDEVSALKVGQISALVVQNPYKIGYQGLAEVYQLLKGKKVPAFTDTGNVVATKANFNNPTIHKFLFPPTIH